MKNEHKSNKKSFFIYNRETGTSHLIVAESSLSNWQLVKQVYGKLGIPENTAPTLSFKGRPLRPNACNCLPHNASITLLSSCALPGGADN